jgi:hypothetical protein
MMFLQKHYIWEYSRGRRDLIILEVVLKVGPPVRATGSYNKLRLEQSVLGGGVSFQRLQGTT